ncbi:MAG: hypothetical protein HYZ53_14435 [Planctomycetes bacterium]|nr:hypothetical protein [Planctomycetota bacterium]
MKRKVAIGIALAVFLGGPLALISTPCLEALRGVAMKHSKDWTTAHTWVERIAWFYRYTGRYEEATVAYEDYLKTWDTNHIDWPENKFLYCRSLEDWGDSLDYNASPEVGAKRKELRDRAVQNYLEFSAWYPDDPRKAESDKAASRLRLGH